MPVGDWRQSLEHTGESVGNSSPPQHEYKKAQFQMTVDYDQADILSFEWGDIQMLSKIVGNTVNPLTGDRHLKMVPYENSVQPVACQGDGTT
ncbi:hypothetical protein [Mycolicibacterium thermoresistibile]